MFRPWPRRAPGESGASGSPWLARLRRALPVLLTLALVAGLAVEASFQTDQSWRLERLNETGMAATRLLAAAHGAFEPEENAAASGRRVDALSAARSVAEAMSQSLASAGPAPAWLAPAPPMQPLSDGWKDVADNAGQVQSLAVSGGELRAGALALESAFIRMRVSSNALLDELASAEAKPAQMRAAARQLALVERLVAGARALAGERDLLAWADRLGRDAVAFGDLINALETGSQSPRIPRVLKRDAADVLTGLAREFRQSVPALESVLNLSARREDPASSLAALVQSVERAGELGRTLRLALEQRASARVPRPVHLIWLAVVALLAFIAATVAGVREWRLARAQRDGAESQTGQRVESVQQSRDTLRRQLEQLAHGIGQVADGQTDLRRRPDADEDPVVTLAFSTLERLTDRMREHADQGLRLVRGGALLGDITRTLREESRRQSEVMEQMSLATRDMAAGLDPLTQDGLQAAEAARSSSLTANDAGASVTQGVAELEALHGCAEECARRVRRLEDAARQMLAVRELTEDVSELGKLLSLNVAIQASVDSAASRALTNFSEEVQRLSQRARGAMLKIDVVHRELRDEAQQAAGASEQAVARARAAMTRVQGAGASLHALDRAARDLDSIGERLQRRQREHAQRVTSVVRSITALHQSTAVLRQQVDVTVDSSTALADAGCGFEQALERRSGVHRQVLSSPAPAASAGQWGPGPFGERAAELEQAGEGVTRAPEPR